MKNADVLPPTSEQQALQPRKNRQSGSLSQRKSENQRRDRDTAKPALTSKIVTGHWKQSETMEPQFARRSTNQDLKNKAEKCSRKTTKQATAEGTVVAERTKAEGTRDRYSAVRPQKAPTLPTQ